MENPAELALSLSPIRLPADYAVFGAMDALAAFSVGIAIAIVALILLRPFMARRVDPVAEIKTEIAAAANLPTGERAHQLARLLKRLNHRGGGRVMRDLEPALYHPGATADFAVVEAAILKAAQTRQRAP